MIISLVIFLFYISQLLRAAYAMSMKINSYFIYERTKIVLLLSVAGSKANAVVFSYYAKEDTKFCAFGIGKASDDKRWSCWCSLDERDTGSGVCQAGS